jgi:uncharacterized protein (DUF1697 family)
MKQTEYLVLLRGINVGGNNLIKMNELKKIFEEMNFVDVITYIQSGNIIFNDFEKSKSKIMEKIEQKLFDKLKSKITTVVLTFPELKEIIDKKPEGFGEYKDEYKYDVVFLIEPLKAKDAIKEFEPRDGVDKIYEGKNVLYFSRLIKQLTKSKISKIVGSSIYKNISIRNWNTTEKLYELMNKNNKKN